jgi:dTDP-4-dehydrorhamnose reductase
MEMSFTSASTILVTGANGQLGKELQQFVTLHPSYQFLFVTRDQLPIENFQLVSNYFAHQKIDYCINCAAYTAVDKAEAESEKAYLVNAAAVGNLAQTCHQHKAGFIHISTDYVFDGTSSIPYMEDDPIAPVNTYGASKLRGEELALVNNPSTLIIRTSWVYSAFGNNFVKTMLRLMQEKESINVIDDQYGCPTYAADLAGVIMEIIDQAKANPLSGIFNYCNEGVTSWYEFALSIKQMINSNCIVNSIPSSGYVTAARRPKYSVLDTAKIRKTLNISIPHWRSALKRCLSQLAVKS